jgi:hypothetical protein
MKATKAMSGFLCALFFGLSLTACGDEFKDSFDTSFKESYKESFIESCSEADANNQELRAFCVCTATKAVEQLTVAELTEDALNKKIILEKIAPQCR